MKQVKIVFVVILLTLSANAGWKSLKTLGHYGPKSFTLKEGVQYVELRMYSQNELRAYPPKIPKTITTTITSSLRIYNDSPYNKRVFERMPMKERNAFKKGGYYGMVSSISWYYNGFMQDNAGKTWRLENAKDVIDMVRPINTSAEISLVLWLYSDAQSNASKWSAKYRKSGKGYIVKVHYIINDSAYGCGDYKYQYKISRSGKITQKKLLSKKAAKECGGE